MFKHKSTVSLTLFTTAVFLAAVILSSLFALDSVRRIQEERNERFAEGLADEIIGRILAGEDAEKINLPFCAFAVYDTEGQIVFKQIGATEYDYLLESDTIVLNNKAAVSQKDFSGGAVRVVSEVYSPDLFWYNYSGIIALVVTFTVISFFVSSLLIDRVLNPLRVMIEKVKAIGNRNFEEKLVLTSEDDEMKEYALVFNEMVDKLNDYIEKQKRFISDASHELATPITVINGHTDLLLRWGSEDRQTLEKSLNIIKSEALGMNGLIEALLFFARSDSSRLNYNFQAEEAGSLIEETLEEFRLLRDDFVFNFDSDGESEVKADRDALKRVFRIILSNAVKYGGEIKKVEVRLISENKNHEGGSVQISFKDFGGGIKEEYLEKIFDRFFRADDSRTKKTGGTGLGLAIAKEIVQAHGGEIFARNNRGAEIIISLPFFIKP